MLVGVSLALALLVVAVGARAIRKRRRDEIRSIHHYHERLDTLHVEPHDRGGSVRVVRRGAGPHASTWIPTARGSIPEAARLAPWDPAGPPEEPGRHDRTWALERMQPHARVDTGTVLIVAVVVGILVAIALAGYADPARAQLARPRPRPPTRSRPWTHGRSAPRSAPRRAPRSPGWSRPSLWSRSS